MQWSNAKGFEILLNKGTSLEPFCILSSNCTDNDIKPTTSVLPVQQKHVMKLSADLMSLLLLNLLPQMYEIQRLNSARVSTISSRTQQRW